ncbi:acetyltransferase-like isoleucine patch superfamily enzyme [Pedobacter cryoconitis]|uniref:acyltransferase n=1 Tax=Pedobacter cryoconitis TaxID=188932 RepID=UPI001621D634|nr:acyltransferase [Pedobacter cryoconitis]MBB6271540.1 acetyltransferase-like isoleucine patch superfamily enzyme [Pedobacter cryoconitis]
MIHSLSDVQTDAIGKDTFVWQFTVILKGAVIGDNCNINCNCFIENDVIIGSNVTLKSGVQVWDGLRIEDNVFVGPNVTFTNDLIPRSKVRLGFKKTVLKKGCSIGANSTIIAGIEIGEKALIGAGSVLTKSVSPYTVWYGNPAIHRGYITEESIILTIDLIDSKTGDKYFLENFKPVKND